MKRPPSLERRDPHPLRRRLLSIPAVVFLFVVTWATLPILLLAGTGLDMLRWMVRRTPFVGVRLVIFLAAYLTAEVAGLLALSWAWVSSRFGRNEARLHDITFSIQRGWAASLLEIVERVFGLQFEVAGTDVLSDTPYLLFARHASIVDNLLAVRFISMPHETRVRYVMKEELRTDPCLDIAGSWLPNVFVRRGAGLTDRETGAVARLGSTAGDDEVILIYPEGTRFTTEKLHRAKAHHRDAGSELDEITRHFENVLPPRLGGPLALLEATTNDVVVLAHAGLDGFAQLSDIWQGAMVGKTVHVEFWRIPRSEIPPSRSAQTLWLYDVWREIDKWAALRRAESPPSTGKT